jgi:hypothetical protein
MYKYWSLKDKMDSKQRAPTTVARSQNIVPEIHVSLIISKRPSMRCLSISPHSAVPNRASQKKMVRKFYVLESKQPEDG